MECQKVQNQFADFFYKDIGNDVRQEVAQHLNNCTNCATLYGNFSKVLSSTDTIKENRLDAFFSARLMAKIENKRTESGNIVFLKKVLQPMWLVSMAALGIFIGVKISNKLPATNLTVENDKSKITITQLASEYYMNNSNEDIVENYYLTDKK